MDVKGFPTTFKEQMQYLADIHGNADKNQISNGEKKSWMTLFDRSMTTWMSEAWPDAFKARETKQLIWYVMFPDDIIEDAARFLGFFSEE